MPMYKSLNIQKQYGVSLLEVLISVVVLSVGLLGIAAMQLSMIRYNHSAQMRSIAVAQGNSMADRLRANHEGVEAGQYNNISGIPADPNCSSCSVSETAQYDAHLWNSFNAKALPSGQGTVIANGNNFIITIYWDNERTGATGLNCSGNDSVDLTCYRMEIEL